MDGWVAFYSYSNIYVGWYKNGLMNGNNMSVTKEWTENFSFDDGWYEDDKFVEPLK